MLSVNIWCEIVKSWLIGGWVLAMITALKKIGVLG